MAGGTLAVVVRFHSNKMKVITKQWFKRNGLPTRELTIECAKGGMWGWRRSRISVAQRSAIRIFVEDDPVSARQLAYSCDLVVLMDQPYNRDVTMPGNVARVGDWDELFTLVRSLS